MPKIFSKVVCLLVQNHHEQQKTFFRPFLYSFKHRSGSTDPCDLGYKGHRQDFAFWNCAEKGECVRKGHACVMKTRTFEGQCSPGFDYEQGYCVQKICPQGLKPCRSSCIEGALPCQGDCNPSFWYCHKTSECIEEKLPCYGQCQDRRIWCQQEGKCVSDHEWQLCPEDNVCVRKNGTQCPSVSLYNHNS